MAESPTYYGNSWDVGDFIRRHELDFHLGNAVKYISRAGKKGVEGKSMTNAYIDDLKKAIHYLENEIQYEESVAYSTSERVQKVLSDCIWTDWETETEVFDR